MRIVLTANPTYVIFKPCFYLLPWDNSKEREMLSF